MYYNKHYITLDEQNCIVDGFSDAFRQPTETDICINEKGSYQFRIYYKFAELDGEPWHLRTEENPPLFDFRDRIPLYKWEDGEVVKRTAEEIEADKPEIPEPEPAPTLDERVTILEESNAEMTEALEMILSGVTE